MRPRRMSRLTLPVVLIAAAIAFPAGASASGGAAQQDLRSAQTSGVQAAQPQPSASDGFDWGNAGIAAAVALGLLCVTGATLLLTTRTRHHPA